MSSKPTIEVIVRGVLIDSGDLLLCRNRKRGHVFLPGGHVEFGEPARPALEREIREEVGLTVRVGDCLGLSEARFPHPTKPGRICHEINILFGMGMVGGLDRSAVVSREEHIEFLWRPLDALAGAAGADDGTAIGAKRQGQVLPPSTMNIVLAAYRTPNQGCRFVTDWE